MIRTWHLLACLLIHNVADTVTLSREPEKQLHSAINPEAKEWPEWVRLHRRFKEHSKQKQPRLVFIGDSITQSWAKHGVTTWNRYYADRDAANYGIAGDRTQHLLWRIEDGCFDGSSPTIIVVLIGTNNIKEERNSPDETVAGIRAVVDLLSVQVPSAQVLLLSTLPCGKHSQSQQRLGVEAVNNELSQCEFGKNIHFLDVGSHFVNADGTISPEIMPDYLHLSARGYEILAEAVEPTLIKLLARSGQGANPTLPATKHRLKDSK